MTDDRDIRLATQALDEQIRLLVKTEHRLHRSQNEVDRQVVRIELLSRFALQWSGRTTAEAVLAGAVGLLGKLFHVDAGRAVNVVDSEQSLVGDLADLDGLPRAHAAPFVRVADPDVRAFLQTISAPTVILGPDTPAVFETFCQDAQIVASVESAQVVRLILPLRDGNDRPTLFLVSASRILTRASHLREAPSTKHVPFLRLMCNHVEHMLRNTRLLEDLARSQDRLEAARDELEERVRARTQQLESEIAERRQAQNELMVARDAAEAASRAKSTFLANMSHELRTPLNAIIGYSELLREDAVAEAREHLSTDLTRIISAGQHLLRLVNDLLDLSKVDAGKMSVHPEILDVASLLQDVAATAGGLARKNANCLVVAASVDVGQLKADRTRVAQILLNLLSNAAKFTQGGVIRLEASRSEGDDGTWVVFRVADTGIGMSSDQVAGLFQDFMQADPSITRKYGGTGLGLAISRRLCHLMAGRIDVTSSPDAGTVFTVWLPANDEAPAADEPPVSGAA